MKRAKGTLCSIVTDLLEHWQSDLMLGMPKPPVPTYELDTVAYFAIKNYHTNSNSRYPETTASPGLADKHKPIFTLKVWQRVPPPCFSHHIQGQEAVCITSSSDASELSTALTAEMRLDYWNTVLNDAKNV